MAVDLFIPEVWAAELLTTLPRKYVFAQSGVVNRDYEGEIAAFGDTVHIGTLTDPTISTYVKNVTVINPETLTTADETLLIDQSKYFSFEVDDVDARQVRDDGQLLTKAADRSADGLAKAADTFISGLMVANAGTVLAAADAATPDAAYRLVRRLKIALDKNDIPFAGRFLIVAPEFYGLLLGDNRFINAQAYGSTDPIRNGEVGSILGFAVMLSNTIPAGTAGTGTEVSNFVVAGHGIATTFADQINKVEAYRPESSFGDALKGLHLYGARVVRPEALAIVDVDVDPLAPGF
jgi:N4-gp56 family major capsid protein